MVFTNTSEPVGRANDVEDQAGTMLSLASDLSTGVEKPTYTHIVRNIKIAATEAERQLDKLGEFVSEDDAYHALKEQATHIEDVAELLEHEVEEEGLGQSGEIRRKQAELLEHIATFHQLSQGVSNAVKKHLSEQANV